jgi:hypothetical protein
MTTSNFLIAPINDGLRKDIKPFATPEDSFQSLLNAYQYRGRIVRRQGYKLLGNLSNQLPVMGLRTQELFELGLQALIAFDTTNAYLYNTTTELFEFLPSTVPVVWSGTNYQFFWTINYAGAFWATNSKPGINGWAVQTFANESGTGTSATVQVTAAGNTVAVGDYVYFVNMTGSSTKANNLIFAIVTVINTPGSIFTVQALSYPKGVNAFTNGAEATGYVMDSMQAITGQDGIKYYADTNIGTTWVNYQPPLDPNTVLAGCLLMFSYRGYLVFLNTWEGNNPNSLFNYENRARWTQEGTPYYSQPAPITPNIQSVDPLAARRDLFGRGSSVDAPTQEAIIGAAFIRDILVVYFERSTWRLRFVNNSENPFVWERVNVELGASSTFSTIPFDKGLMAIGNRGIVISDSNDTSRFDEKIPDDIFAIRQANEGLQRVYGIRTFRTRLNYWTIPSDLNPNGTFPDLVLVFNYDTKNWGYFDDCFTCFGYFYANEVGYTWNDLDQPWTSYTVQGATTGVSEEGTETIIAGNQQGFVFLLEQTSGTNDPSLYISAISGQTISSPNNNLPDGTWITLSGITGTTGTDGVSLNGRNFKISNPTLDPTNFTLNEFASIDGGAADGSLYVFQIDYVPIIPGSVQINVGTLVFQDTDLDGSLISSGGFGTIDYNTGTIVLNFVPPISSTEVYIRVVSYNNEQELEPVATIGAYTGEGLIAKISNFDIQTKVFNFMKNDMRARLSKIDFYTDATANGQFTCDIWADSSNIPVNTPLSDNPQSNVVLTSPNPYQVGNGSETIFRLFCDAIAQTLQFRFYMSDRQMAVTVINTEDVEILGMMVSMRKGGRLV